MDTILDLVRQSSDTEQSRRLCAMRTLLAAWRDEDSETISDYRHAMSQGVDQIRVISKTKLQDGDYYPPLSTP